MCTWLLVICCQWSPSEAQIQLYASLVRPHLEYASKVSMEFPSHEGHIKPTEMSRNFHSKFVLSSGTQALQFSNLPIHLSDCRNYLGLCYFYKTVNDIFEFHNCPLTLRVLYYCNRNGCWVLHCSELGLKPPQKFLQLRETECLHFLGFRVNCF